MRKILLVFLFLTIISFGLFAIEGNKIPIVTDQAELDLYIGKIITIEDKGEKQDDMKNKTTTDTSKNLQPVNADKKKMTIQITKDGEVWIQGEQLL